MKEYREMRKTKRTKSLERLDLNQMNVIGIGCQLDLTGSRQALVGFCGAQNFSHWKAKTYSRKTLQRGVTAVR
jgi:hypothetical protein